VNDTLIAIISCKMNISRVQAQLETWIPQAREAGYTVEIFDGDRLAVPDDYLSLPLKTQSLCRWALDHGYKHLLKLDDDAYLKITRFTTVIEDYAGMWIPKNDMGMPKLDIVPLPRGTTKFDYASGGGYWLSERSMKIIAAAPINDWAEDRWVGQILGATGIFFKTIPDYIVQGYAFYKSDDPILITQVKDMRNLK
jgi:hypothetical protein